MTGMEAWDLIAPIIAAHSVMTLKDGKIKLNPLDHAYITVYAALKAMDEREKKQK